MKYLFFLFLIPFQLLAQNNDKFKTQFFNNTAIEGMHQNGYIFPTNDFVRGHNTEKDTIDAFRAFSLKFSKQTTGEHQWEQLFNYPRYGIGFSLYDFHNPEEIGTPLAVYGFFNAPFKRWEKWSLNYEIGFGATFNWKYFNPVTNKYNTAIGAGQSFYIDAGLLVNYQLNQHLNMETGFSLTHFSNGALKKPNKGLNTIAPKISVKYSFDEFPTFSKREIKTFQAKNEYLLSLFVGKKNVIFNDANIDVVEKFEGINFPVFGISSIYNRQVSYKSKFGIGMSLSYNGAINAQVAVDNNELEATDGWFADKLQISIYPSYELIVNKFSLVLQPAFYIYRKKLKNQTPVFHQRIGLKYRISKKLFTSITLRDYKFQVSDFIEWHIGYKIK
jgi:hypothetical protein